MVDKIVDPSVAIKAYGAAQSAAQKGITSGDDGVSFSDFLKQTAEDSIKTLKGGETASAKAVTGEADLTDVVEAVTAAELTLQTVVAVRDRLIGAYQEIMRMPV
jgi:flagellar hook-basal body complex protein FliE